MTVRERDDRVLPLTRGVAAAIVPFLVVAFVVLYPFPGDTKRLFAWQIRPTLTAMLLGSAYVGGAYFFVRVAAARSWRSVKAGFVPVGVFASLLGIATVLHWGKFNHHHLAFWLWAGLYFSTPFLVFGVYAGNRRADAPAGPDDLLLPLPAARLIAAVGGLALGTGAFLFLVPRAAIAIWPWTLTPLTARVLGAVFCLGLAGLGAPLDRRWQSARIPFQVAGLMLVLMLIAGVRAHAQLDPGSVLTWLLAAGFAGATVALVTGYARMERLAAPTGAPVRG